MTESAPTLYGVRLVGDVGFLPPLPALPFRRTLRVVRGVPETLRRRTAHRFPLYRAHGREVLLASDRLSESHEPGRPWCYEVQGIARFYWVGGGNGPFIWMKGTRLPKGHSG